MVPSASRGNCATSLYIRTLFYVTFNITPRQQRLPLRRTAKPGEPLICAGPGCDIVHRFSSRAAVRDEVWPASQYTPGGISIVSIMSAKYYTQFRLNDTSYQGGNEFSGVIELNRPIDQDWEIADIEAVLARNFDLQQDEVTLLSWSRLH